MGRFMMACMEWLMQRLYAASYGALYRCYECQWHRDSKHDVKYSSSAVQLMWPAFFVSSSVSTLAVACCAEEDPAPVSQSDFNHERCHATSSSAFTPSSILHSRPARPFHAYM